MCVNNINNYFQKYLQTLFKCHSLTKNPFIHCNKLYFYSIFRVDDLEESVEHLD